MYSLGRPKRWINGQTNGWMDGMDRCIDKRLDTQTRGKIDGWMGRSQNAQVKGQNTEWAKEKKCRKD